MSQKIQVPFQVHSFAKRTDSCHIRGWLEARSDSWCLRYEIHQPPAKLVWPSLTEKAQYRDNLWQNTCCELFYRLKDSTAYTEWNFSPTGDWAAYQFKDYRLLDYPLKKVSPLTLETSQSGDVYSLEVSLPRPSGEAWLCQISVILNEGSELSYWSLLHPASKPDFHDPRGFALKVEAG